jgi:hypothetical protein
MPAPAARESVKDAISALLPAADGQSSPAAISGRMRALVSQFEFSVLSYCGDRTAIGHNLVKMYVNARKMRSIGARPNVDAT